MGETRRILIVDHEPKAVVDMGRLLRSAGYEVLEAPTGKECLGLAHETHPHLILIDEALSDISGIDLVRQIKRDAELAQAYVALLSRDGTAPAIQARALENGADALIVRTAQTRELLARVDALLRRQASEESLRTALRDYRATFDAMSDAVYLVNPEFKIIDCNLAMARLLAKPRSEIVGGRCYELVHGTDNPIPACLGQRVRDSRRRETLVVPMEERWLQVDVDPLLDANGAVIGSVHVLRDITERRHTEETLKQTQAEMELRAAEHHLALDKANKDLQGEVDSRQRMQEILKGVQADLELRTREYEQLTLTQHSTEENLQRVQRELRAVATGAADLVYTWELQSGQTHLVSDSQKRFAGETGGFPATMGELQGMIHPQERRSVEKALAQHVGDGTPWSSEYRVVHHDGQVAHWAVSAMPLGDGPAQEWMAVVRDVTAARRVEQEQETYRAQLNQTQKMEALRRLALGVANEFNRLLGNIVGQMEMILARMEPSHPLYSDLEAIAKAARLGVTLIRRLLAFAGREVVQPEVLDVNALLLKLEPELRRALGQGGELLWVLGPQLKPVFADAHVLQDIWLNLAGRAASAMPKGGALRVHTADVTLTDAYVRGKAARPGDYVRVTMACRSDALPPEALDGLFELQAAASEAGAGGELDLGVVYGLVRQLGGFVEVTQTAAGETAWEVYLPAYAGEGAEEQGSTGPQEGTSGGEKPEERERLAEEGGAEAGETAVSGEHPITEPTEAGALGATAAQEPVTPEPASATTDAAAVPPPVAEPSPAEMPEQAVPTVESPAAVQEPMASAPTADEGTASGAPDQVPAWLVEEPSQSDITQPGPGTVDTAEERPGDITEAKPPSPPSGLSALRSRLRRLGRRKD